MDLHGYQKMTLADHRRAAGFKTQEELSKLLGLTRPAVARWESGDRCPHGFMLRRLAPILGISEGDIIAAIMSAKMTDTDEAESDESNLVERVTEASQTQ